MGLLDGKVALISGTAGGQGRAAAHVFTREGAKVVACDVQAEENEQTVADVRRAGGEITGFAPVDLTEPGEAERWVEDGVRAYGGIDVVYNNAGRVRFGPIADYGLEDWRATIAGELDLTFFVTKFAWRHLVERGGGVVINIASTAGMVGSPFRDMVAHSAAKGGVIGFTRQVAVEGAPHGIRAVAISPGPTWTPALARSTRGDPEREEDIIGRTLLRRWGRPEEIAEVAAFFASDRASFVTGVNVPVDGGMTAW
jgi:NAD(P)-dependent dehydrogenase (short-subunit alcohol dehydrogenase family)